MLRCAHLVDPGLTPAPAMQVHRQEAVHCADFWMPAARSAWHPYSSALYLWAAPAWRPALGWAAAQLHLRLSEVYETPAGSAAAGSSLLLKTECRYSRSHQTPCMQEVVLSMLSILQSNP